jgi:hypothetical protein
MPILAAPYSKTSLSLTRSGEELSMAYLQEQRSHSASQKTR